MTITLTDGGKVPVTTEHPFYTPDRGWVESGNLKVGDKLLQRDGKTAVIASITRTTKTTTVYNFAVANDHNYYVGSSSLLVHNCPPETLYHYTNEAGHNGILESGVLLPSTKANSPKDAFFGDGQYLTDIAPGTERPGQLSRAFLGHPWAGRRFTHYVEIDVRGLDLFHGREGVFVHNAGDSLDIAKRILGSGAN
jgi:hypothetical protein